MKKTYDMYNTLNGRLDEGSMHIHSTAGCIGEGYCTMTNSNSWYYRPESIISTAWMGTHVVLLHCLYQTNETLAIAKSDHAPSEPPSKSCAETLSRYLSIGYQLIGAFPLRDETIQYVLIYR